MSDSSHRITLARGVALTARARATGRLAITAWAFDRDIFDAILAQPGATGVRIYMGAHEDGSLTPVLVGINPDGEDITTGVIGQEAKPCPPFCDQSSPLHG